MDVINNDLYKLKASEISQTFKNAGGAKVAVDNILSVASKLQIFNSKSGVYITINPTFTKQLRFIIIYT